MRSAWLGGAGRVDRELDGVRDEEQVASVYVPDSHAGTVPEAVGIYGRSMRTAPRSRRDVALTVKYWGSWSRPRRYSTDQAASDADRAHPAAAAERFPKEIPQLRSHRERVVFGAARDHVPPTGR